MVVADPTVDWTCTTRSKVPTLPCRFRTGRMVRMGRVPAVLMDWVIVAEGLFWNGALARNWATTLWVPMPSDEVVNDAWPVAALSGTVATVVPSTLKATEPLGVPAPGLEGAPVAVNVTGCPVSATGLDELSVVVVANEMGAEVLPA